MHRCTIVRCKNEPFTRSLCLMHLLEVGRIALSAYSDSRHIGCRRAFASALRHFAEKAFIDDQWARVSQRMIDRQLEVSRAFPKADFARFAVECVMGPSETARRKAAMETELRQIATKHGFEMTDGPHYHKAIKKTIAHAAKNNGTRVRWDTRKARRKKVSNVIS